MLIEVACLVLFGLYSVALCGIGFYVGRMSKWKEDVGIPPMEFSTILPAGNDHLPEDREGSSRKEVSLMQD